MPGTRAAACVRPRRRASGGGGVRLWELHDEEGSAAVCVDGADCAAVRAHYVGDYREPETGARTPALAAGLGAPEAVEEVLERVGREAASVISHTELDLAVEVAQRDLDGGVGGRVHEGVSHEVGEHGTQLVRVAVDDGGGGGIDAYR